MRFRTAVNAFTGLMLLAHGFALTAVVIPQVASAGSSATSTEMPCHHAQAPAAPKPKCCDDGCLGMVACVTAHVALMSPRFVIDSPAVQLPALTERATALPPPRAVVHLRPPITLHA